MWDPVGFERPQDSVHVLLCLNIQAKVLDSHCMEHVCVKNDSNTSSPPSVLQLGSFSQDLAPVPHAVWSRRNLRPDVQPPVMEPAVSVVCRALKNIDIGNT